MRKTSFFLEIFLSFTESASILLHLLRQLQLAVQSTAAFCFLVTTANSTHE